LTSEERATSAGHRLEVLGGSCQDGFRKFLLVTLALTFERR
jgi:hypothetical protein